MKNHKSKAEEPDCTREKPVGTDSGGKGQDGVLPGATKKKTSACRMESRMSKEELIATGCFIKNTSGVGFHPNFVRELYSLYPKQSIEEGLAKKNLTAEDVGHRRISRLREKMDQAKKEGMPEDDFALMFYVSNSGTGNTKPMSEEELIASGTFIKQKFGIALSKDVERQVLANFPETSIAEILAKHGLSVENVGVTRVQRLQAKYGKLNGKDPALFQDAPRCTVYSPKVLSVYSNHPYVGRCTENSIELNDRFMDEAHRLDLPIHSLLRTFCIDPGLFSREERIRLVQSIQDWPDVPIKEPGLEEIMGCSAILEQVYFNRLQGLEAGFDAKLARYKEAIPAMSYAEKKDLFMAIQEMPKDASGKYTLSQMLDTLGISKTTYYGVLANNDYGEAAAAKDAQDLEDVILIRKVMDYKGFRKGARQIYMMMEQITGTQYGLQKIRRLMNKFDLHSGIRMPNEEKRRMREYVKGQVKPNTLKRRFRLYRPNEVRLTDVTYLSYGPKGKRAYCSASIDPVTSKVAAINVSENNDLDLVEETLRLMSEDDRIKGGFLHSDRGCLYLTPDFQEAVKKMGLAQSMSKLGCCWDNSPEEAFNGNLKQEVDFSSCETFEDLKELIEKYWTYYNTERHVYNRKQMTPVEYEEYLLGLSDGEWDAYLEEEEKKYEDMKTKAQKRAKEHSKNLGV